MSCAPDFLFIGPSKAASSWLFERLRQHPDVFVPDAKDIYYFDRNYDRGGDWYRSHFGRPADGFATRGEVCHDYLYSPEAADRIATDLPEVKLLFGFRDPVERSISHLRQSIRMGNVTGDIHRALATNPNIIDHSRYSRHLQPFLERFRPERFFVVPFDEISAEPAPLLCSIFDFLAVSHDPAVLADADERVNPAAKARFPGGGDLARIGANTLRSLGLETTLGRLKRSRLRTALFSEIDLTDMADVTAAKQWRSVIAEQLAGEEAATRALLADHGVAGSVAGR